MLYLSLFILILFVVVLLMDRNLFCRLIGCRFPLVVEVTPRQGGIVTPSEGKYRANTRVTITAIPYSGWHFNRWEGDLAGASNPATLVMDQPKIIVAVFVKPVDHEVPTLPRTDRVPSVV